MKRRRRPRPSSRQLSAALVVLGLLAGLAILVLPVEAAFDDHPILALQPFSPGLAGAVTEVDCGVAVGNLGRRADGLSLYNLALDDACRAAASRRAVTAVAAAGVIGLLGLIGLTGSRSRPPAQLLEAA
jgi:hypothetical protein